MDTIMVGASVLDITSPVGMEMGGYGARVGVATGIHDNLNVRTLVLDDGATRLVIAICDFVGVGPIIVQKARDLIAADFGIPPENVCIAATHTHSGPLTVRTGDGVDFSTVTAAKIAGSVRIALGGLQPVGLKVGLTDVSTISQNRRDPSGPKETTLKVLVAAAEGAPEPVATVINYACHATVLEYDNMLYSADFPGVAVKLLEQALGGTAIYMQGTCGDVNPVWMRHDFAEIRRIGSIVGAAATRAVAEIRPVGEEQFCRILSWEESVPASLADGTVLSGLGLGAARTYVDLPRKGLPPLAEIEAEIKEIEDQLAALPEGDIDGSRAIRPKLAQLRMDRATTNRFPYEPGATQRLEVQAFRLSNEAAIVMLPGEFFTETGWAIEKRSGLRHVFVCAYANDYAGYFAPANEFPCAGYEVGSTRFGPEAEGIIVDTALGLLKTLFPRGQP